ncbi:MAG TPA: HAMP domain-containing sensor histidine kinase [Bacteroidales bacterium]|nr:HAMP domain-containing sensor histidine kinase [Bacteroidales bacterium]
MMKRGLLIAMSLSAILVFLLVQVYLVDNIWKQKEEQLNFRYTALSRDALASMMKRSGQNGFEKSMTILDIFSDLITQKELSRCKNRQDSLVLGRQAMVEAGSIIAKNESFTDYLKLYIGHLGYDTTFKTRVIVRRYEIFHSGIGEETAEPYIKHGSLVFVNNFSEERDHFVIEFDYLIKLEQRNRIVFSEILLSLSLILASLIIVLAGYWLTLRNLMEEKRLSDLKSDFINNMTHELKTPLSTITVAGRTLEMEQVSANGEKVRETARMIGKQSVHLNQLINTILEVSLLEREQFSPEMKPVVIDELLHDIAEAFITSCNNGVEIKEDLRCTGIVTEADILYFTTMINNLLSNAVKYCDKEPVIVILSAIEAKTINISITDNGIGISREHISHVFDKFYRVPQGNIHKVKGLGLGLYYVKRIANAHGGEVSVTSKPGKGTTFVINLPIKQ